MSISLSALGLFRLGVAAPELRVGDVRFNVAEILDAAGRAAAEGCQLLLFPELSITGYTCADLFYQPLLLNEAEDALWQIVARAPIPVVVGSPVRAGGRLFNCAVLMAGGEIIGAVPKTFIPNTCEFYEKRWFSGACGAREGGVSKVKLERGEVPFGADLLFRCRTMPTCIIGIEICEDLWAINPPSGFMAASGATLILNPSASHEFLGKVDYRRMLIQSQSARCITGYGYASAGPGESTTDLVFSGHCMIAENGTLLAQTERFQFSTQMVLSDVDIERITLERLKNDTFAASTGRPYRILEFAAPEVTAEPLYRTISATPFVPAQTEERSQRCREIFAIQTTALAKRLRHTGITAAVLGISGGLDSTLALLVCVKAFGKIGLDLKRIWAITMPGFGTTARTRSNAVKLAEILGVSFKTISIEKSVEQHFKDIGHDRAVEDVTYENAQARERTQILMDVANQVQGLVIGTGDLSEIALGWCTYNGDHMSMYGVNAGVPKTLVRHLVEWCAGNEFFDEAARTLLDICATPISPELLPPKEDGNICQFTEERIGPYLLHDFFLYHAIRLQFSPRKVFFLARIAFADRYPPEEILKWLKVFYLRFFSQQFKRSCMPDGPKVGTVALSPRGDWRMPSDASAALWMKELENDSF